MGKKALTHLEGRWILTADILGDWREEIVIYTGGELRIYSTVIPAADRRVCLMQDPLYRNDVTHRSMGYPHYPMTSYYLGIDTNASADDGPVIKKDMKTYAK